MQRYIWVIIRVMDRHWGAIAGRPGAPIGVSSPIGQLPMPIGVATAKFQTNTSLSPIYC
jgi:hypothetical protein